MGKRKTTSSKRTSKKQKFSKIRYLISVDVGVVNFAYSIVECKTMKILACKNKKVCEFRGSKDYVNMCDTVMNFFAETIDPSMWSETDLVIERQMKSGIMRLFAVSLEVAWYHRSGHRAHVVSPVSVKRHFGTSTGNYKKNKKAAINLMPKICSKYPGIHKTWVKLCSTHDKIDDLADALIQGCYFVETMRSGTK